MKLTIKSLKQIPYDVDIDGEGNTIKELKQAIEKAHGFDHTSLKLVFNGVVLDDLKKLVDCGIKEGNVIVMMNAKAKPTNVQKEEAKTEENPPQTTTIPNSSIVSNSNSNLTNVPQITTPSQVKPQAAPQKDYTNEVNSLVEMGFIQQEAQAAIKAAKGNISVAIEFLYNGIPENIPAEEQFSEEDSSTPQAVLKNIASIVKVLCYNNPSQLQNILLTLQQNSPELMELIRENEDEFKNLIQQPITDNDVKAFQEFNKQARGEGGLGSIAGNISGQGQSTSQSGPVSGRDNVIRLSKQDYDAVGRLKELGFSEMDAVQAYFACDKNEDSAANLLWENKLSEQEQEMYIDYSQIGGGNSNQHNGQSSSQQIGHQGNQQTNQQGGQNSQNNEQQGEHNTNSNQDTSSSNKNEDDNKQNTKNPDNQGDQ